MFCVSLIFIYTSYTANIVALLQSTSDRIRTLSDLSKSNIELGVQDTPYSHALFPLENDPIRRKIFLEKIEPPNQPKHYYNASYGVSRMRNEFFGFHMEYGICYKYIKNTFLEHEKCGLQQIIFLRTIDPRYGIPKNSPYKEIFKVKLVIIPKKLLLVCEFCW